MSGHDDHHEYEGGDWEVAGSEAGDEWDDPGGHVGETPDVDARISPTPGPDPTHDPLAGLRSADRLQLWRVKPAWAKGFLGSLDLDPGDELDLAALKAEWGGGTFRIRPQRNEGNGYRFTKGGIDVQISGPPLEAGRPLGRHGQVIDAPAREVNPTPTVPAVVRRGGGTEGMEILGNLFDGLREDLRGLRAEVAELREHRANPKPPDPVSEIRKSVEFVRELQSLGALFNGQPIPDADDDDDDDEPERTPGVAGLLEQYLSAKIDAGEDPLASVMGQPQQQQPQQATPQPRLIKQPQRPATPPAPQQPVAQAPTQPAPQPEPDPEPTEAAQVLPIDPFAGEHAPASDPWEATAPAEPGRAEQTANVVTPEQVAAMLAAMPDDQALGLLQGAVEHMPPERLIQMVQGMQAERGAG